MINFNADLVDDLARQKVILFLGAGVTASAVTRAGTRMKGWSDFLTALCDELPGGVQDQVKALIGAKDFLLACEIIQQELQDAWDRKLSDEFGQAAEPSELHRAIVELDQRLIVTTNFDKLIESCWETKLGTSRHLPRTITKIDSNAFSMLKDHSSKFLIKIHGTVDDSDKMIFSRSEYIKYTFGSSEYNSFLESMLLNYTFLFIGFSMDDPAICSLLEMYALRFPKSRPHYIFTSAGTPRNIIDINKKLRKLIVLEYDSKENHKELPDIIRALSKEMIKRKKEIFSAGLSLVT